MSTIRTPDQRVRVFISSTMQELSPERKAAKQAIERLKLIPVLFEMAARPHPPQELYKAYLEQSHIFVGIYGKSYGWIAPDMTISGLEDEFRLAEKKPKLIYVKDNIPDRDERLTLLLKELQQHGNVSYRKYSSIQEFEELLSNDLALMLSENFENSLSGPVAVAPADAIPVHHLPEMRLSLIGREEELSTLKKMALNDAVPLITITGTGGIGKSAIALRLAHELKQSFPEGVHFISLSSITDPKLLTSSIVSGIGIYDLGNEDLEVKLIHFLESRKTLLILDNFEQISEAADQVANLLNKCPHLTIIITSRTPLHLRIEQVFPLQPLKSPTLQQIDQNQQLSEFAAVNMFIQKAMEANPFLNFNSESIKAIAQICNKLDGLPLAIELAASRIKYMTPQALLSKMSNLLDMLSKGQRDLPKRQQTIRAAIEWSYNLLDADTQLFFNRLSIFKAGWSLEAAEQICMDGLSGDLQEMTERLVDMNLLQPLFYNFESTEPRFDMLNTVWEFAHEKLSALPEYEALKETHCRYFVDLVAEIEPFTWTNQREIYFDKIENEQYNLRLAFDHALLKGNRADAWQIIGELSQFWMYRGYISEGLHAANKAGIGYDGINKIPSEEIPSLIQAKALRSSAVMKFYVGRIEECMRECMYAIELYNQLNQPMEVYRLNSYAGVIEIISGNMQSVSKVMEAYQEALKQGDGDILLTSCTCLIELYVAMQDYTTALKLIRAAAEVIHKKEDYGLLALMKLLESNINIVTNDFEKAELLINEASKLFPPKIQYFYLNWSYFNTAVCKLFKNEEAEAYKYFKKSMSLVQESGDLLGIHYCLIGFAALDVQQEHYKQGALRCFVAQNLYEKSNYKMWTTTKFLHQWVSDRVNEKLTEEQLVLLKAYAETINSSEALQLVKDCTVKIPGMITDEYTIGEEPVMDVV